jgi:hypothetical protein
VGRSFPYVWQSPFAKQLLVNHKHSTSIETVEEIDQKKWETGKVAICTPVPTWPHRASHVNVDDSRKLRISNTFLIAHCQRECTVSSAPAILGIRNDFFVNFV